MEDITLDCVVSVCVWLLIPVIFLFLFHTHFVVLFRTIINIFVCHLLYSKNVVHDSKNPTFKNKLCEGCWLLYENWFVFLRALSNKSWNNLFLENFSSIGSQRDDEIFAIGLISIIHHSKDWLEDEKEC